MSPTATAPYVSQAQAAMFTPSTAEQTVRAKVPLSSTLNLPLLTDGRGSACSQVMMFSSDVSARGVDYPDVSLVVQVCL